MADIDETTLEEAIEILDDGEWWGSLSAWYESESPEYVKLEDAVDMAIAALRAQQEAEKNEPLTLDELREMDGEHVWIERIGGRIPYDHGWAIVHREDCLCRTEDGCNAFFELYGIGWLAYDASPSKKGEANE